MKMSLTKRYSRQIAERDGGWECTYCGCPLIPDGTPDKEDSELQQRGYRHAYLDHVLPVNRGGTNEPSNLVLSCTWCNGRKGNKTPSEYAAWLGDRRSK